MSEQEFIPWQSLARARDAIESLKQSYDWPGHVRELRSVIRTLALESKMPFIDAPEVEALIRKSDLVTLVPRLTENTDSIADSFQPRPDLSFDENVCLFEKYIVSAALRGKNNVQAREALGLSRSRFYEKLKQYAIHSRDQA